MSSLPIIAAIPTYNEQDNIGNLLNQVLADNYDCVYVLDDRSIDNTVEIAKGFGKEVRVINGYENVGTAANRNRIIPELSRLSIIQFFDADISLNTSDNPERARELATDPRIGYTGGLIRNSEGRQLEWNYGPAFSLPQLFSAVAQAKISEQEARHPSRAAKTRMVLNKWSLMRQWPNPQRSPQRKIVYWTTEANSIFRSDIFASIGGFNENLRYHEAMDMSYRMEKIGLKRVFDPSIDVTHLDGDYQNKSRTGEFWQAYAKIIGTIGLRDFIFKPPFSEQA